MRAVRLVRLAKRAETFYDHTVSNVPKRSSLW
jgi:hypothetical protein